MRYKLSLHDRRRLAEGKRRRYWADPAERLKRVNAARQYQGLPPVMSLDEIETRGRRA